MVKAVSARALRVRLRRRADWRLRHDGGVTSRRKTINDLLEVATASILAREDDNPAAAAITFSGGDYVIPVGESPEDTSVVRHILMALFLYKEPPPEALRLEALRLSLAVLRLADHVTTAARVDRLGHTATPAPMARLKSALQLSSRQLNDVAGEDAREVLAPLTTEDLNEADWTITPLLRDGEAYVLLSPSKLAVTFRHHIIALADRHGWRSELTTRLSHSYAATITGTLERLGWHETSLTSAGGDLPVAHNVWSFDADAEAVVTILHDDLGDYDQSNPDAPWHAELYLEPVAEASRDLITALLYGPDAPDRIMHLVVLAGVGRPSMWFDRVADEVLQVPELSFYAGDLDLISFAERGDPLALWRFVSDSDRQESRYAPEDPLDLFALWRHERHSFYLGDEPPPTFAPVSGYAAALRHEIASSRDRHGVVGPAGRGIVEVVRRFDDLNVPLYRPLTSNLNGMVVDTRGHRYWVLSGAPERSLNQLVDALAFWLWQLAEDLDRDVLEFHVSLGDELVVDEVAPDHFDVALDPVHQPLFHTAANEGERELVRALLIAINGTAPDETVNRVAPLGPKKMILAFGAQADRALDGRGLPPGRPPLRESDDAEAMDELGEFLREQVGLPLGPIADDERVKVLWSSITFHLDALLQLISTLHPKGVLEGLIAVNERLLNQGAFLRYTIPTRIACYGDALDIEAELRHDSEIHAAASTAVRFLIECLAAQPPRGIRPMSLAVQDRLVALAFQVGARGGVSDAIREGLDDTQLSILPSGRLGVSRDGRYYSGRAKFADRFIVSEVRRSHAHFPSLWDDEPGNVADANADAAMLNEAAMQEWGATLTEILELFGFLVELSDSKAVTIIALDDVDALVANELGWSGEKLRQTIAHFALGPRPALLEPPEPFDARDVYPWRYGRRLSAIRRPLVIRPTPDGDELVYGFRAVDAAGRQLVHEIQTARLKVESAAMKQAITTLRQRDDLAFNRRIADLYREVDGLVVEERVKSIGKLDIARPDGSVLGDIDVLVLDPRYRRIEAIDTKNLAAARTPSEVARELKRTFATESRTTAAIDKHLERAAWLERHRSEVLVWAGFGDDAQGWSVEPSIVINVEVPAAFVAELPMPVHDVNELAESLSSRA
jgi:hypothetical protein